MRLGAPLPQHFSDPGSWIAALQERGYRAAYCPVEQRNNMLDAYVQAAQEADVLIAEVGAWSNPLSPDEHERGKAIAYCQQRLALAEAIGARCCVNISGSRGSVWDGPHPENLTEESFDLIVETVRKIIDAVHPRRTFYTLETMPWLYPDSTESYVQLLRAIDRKQFAVHFDPANLVNSPQRYYHNGALIREFVSTLGSSIKSCHARDVVLTGGYLPLHLDECRPGLGTLDYRVLLQELERVDSDMPLLLEHLRREEDYALGAQYIRTIAREVEVPL
ncbi:MAG TPA: TIM barrel protein [Ktedonobacteraceae bacterium]|nr:TIM barrel protein [Ktedonobacteraceae bacterium]